MNTDLLLIKLITMEDGRFQKIINALIVKDVCFFCKEFNQKAEDSYRCACIPLCIGKTLSVELKSYLLWKLDIISQDEHFQNLKIGKYAPDAVYPLVQNRIKDASKV